MKRFTAIIYKELKEEFTSPMIYSLAAIFCFIMGYLFYMLVISSQEMTEQSITDSVLRPVMGNINMLMMVFIPLLTMNSFSLEFRKQTIHIYTMNHIPWSVLFAAKFVSRFITIMFLVLSTLIFPLQLMFSGYSDWGVVIVGYLGIGLSVGSYIALGLFCSSLTANSILAALMTFATLFSSFLLAFSSSVSSNFIVGQIVGFLSSVFHFQSFTIGLLRSYDVFYFLAAIILFFYLTIRSLEMRRW